MKKTAMYIATLLVPAFSGYAYGKTLTLNIGTQIRDGATITVSQVGGIQTIINVPIDAAPQLSSGTSVVVNWSGVALNTDGIIAGGYTAGAGGRGGTISLAGGTVSTPFGFGQFATIVFDVPNDSTTQVTDFTYSANGTNPQVLGADAAATNLSASVAIASVTATFDPYPYARIAGTSPRYFSLLQSAFTAVTGASTVQARIHEFNENLVLRNGDVITLNGGYDSVFSLSTGYTTLKGTLTLETGTLTVNKLIIKN